MSGEYESLNACHCCEGVRILTPAEHVNRPGLSALAYRVGTHGSFKATMEAGISSMPSLEALGTRDNGDFTIALMDSWAMVADVLSFYTERIANEGFLRTATEFRSVKELANSIGYEPHPGVAASTYLAFTVEDGPGAASDVPIPAGTKAQNIPDGNDLPQTFETIEDIMAHPEWNAMRPRQTEPQLLDRDTRIFFFEGTNTGLREGDWMLLRVGENADPEDPGEISSIPLQVISVEPNLEKLHTRVEALSPEDSPNGNGGPPVANVPEAESPTPPPPPPQEVFTGAFEPSAEAAAVLARSYNWTGEDSALFAAMHNLDPSVLPRYVNNSVPDPKPDLGTGIFAFRVETAPFGHNAPLWGSLPENWRSEEQEQGGSGGGFEIIDSVGNGVGKEDFDGLGALYPFTWDDFWWIHIDSRGARYAEIYGDGSEGQEMLLLESSLPEILEGSWIIIGTNERSVATFRIVDVDEVSRADFSLSGRFTLLTLEKDEVETSEIFRKHESKDRPIFTLRETTIYAQSESLTLAGKPLGTPVKGDTIELDRMLESQIYRGQWVIVSGTPVGLSDDVVESEVAIVKNADSPASTTTTLVFEEELQRTYRRDTVRLNANVAPATHGERREEVLGFGDASQTFRSFQLSHAPMTYVSAPVPSGSKSSLELRVNGVLWQEAEHFFGLAPTGRNYVLRRNDENKTTIVFGDGNTGQLPPTGAEISSTYRSGIGAPGNLLAGKISLLGSQPRWVQRVINPVKAEGGADPESTTDARRSAPNSVRTFGRIVSLQDFEDFARSFAGISKAKADLVHVGEGNVVHVTICGEDGDPVPDPVPTDSEQYRDLLEAMNRVRDRSRRLMVASYEKRFFDVVAKVRIHSDYPRETVPKAVEKSLRETFSFARRDLGQGVALSEVVATMQRVRGVEAVDLDVLRFSHERNVAQTGTPFRLPALSASWGGKGAFLPAQHLSIASEGIQISEMS